ncbi:MAG TPA: TIGR03435 family protein [Terriglobia bacterium]|jgi:uncharacterized protein (TIGR03435 family)
MIIAAILLILQIANAPVAPLQQFDVASIKANTVTPGCPPFRCGVTTMPRSGRLIIQNYSLRLLIRTAYGIGVDDIHGGPAWRDDDKFDIEAKAGGPVENDRSLFLMLRQLLADRFKLKLHSATREAPVYALVTGSGGLKIRKSQDGISAPRGPLGVGTLQLLRVDADQRRITGTATMTEFATFLSRISGRSLVDPGRPVLDETNVSGGFDINLSWTAEPAFAGELDPALISAIQDRLGLKVEVRKGLAEILVIDSAERPSPD